MALIEGFGLDLGYCQDTLDGDLKLLKIMMEMVNNIDMSTVRRSRKA